MPIRKQNVFLGESSISAPSPWQNVRRHRDQAHGGWQNLLMRQLGQGLAHDWALQKLTIIGEAIGRTFGKHLRVHCLGPSGRRQCFLDPAIRSYKNWGWPDFAKV